MSSAIGEQPGQFPLGLTSADIRNFGAVPNGPDCAPAIQAAHDSLLTPNTTLAGGTNLASGLVRVPAGRWIIQSPIWLDGDNMALVGEDSLVSIIQALTCTQSIIIGVKRRAAWNTALRDTLSLPGTLTFTQGSTQVLGQGTAFRDHLLPGCQIKLNSDGTTYTVASVQSDTQLTLTAPFAGMTASGQATRDMAYLANLPTIFAADHRVDAFGKLDTSVAPAPGQVWGITTTSPSSGSPYPDHFVSVTGLPPATGQRDGWRTIQTLCVDFAIEGPAPLGGGTSGPPQGRAILGMGPPLDAEPWQIDQYYEPAVGHRVFRCTFNTIEGYHPQPGANSRTFIFGNVDAIAGVNRVTVQIDMTTNTDGSTGNAALGSLRAWINGIEQTISRGWGTRLLTATTTEPAFTAGAQLHFAANRTAPFQIGTADRSQNTWNPPGDLAYRGSFTLYGLWVGTSADYTSDSAGNQIRVDGGAVNDAYRYLGAGRNPAHLVARLNLSDPPTADYPGRLVRFVTGTPNASLVVQAGLFLPANGDLQWPAVVNTRVRNLQIESLQQFGCGIVLANCLTVTLDGLDSNSGWRGVSSFNCGAVYDIHIINQCRFSGADCGYYGNSQIIQCDGLKRVDGTYALVRLVGCDATFGPIAVGGYVANPATAVEILGGGYASTYEFARIACDQEAPPSQPLLTCQIHPTGLTRLTIGTIEAGIQDGQTPQIQLTDPYASASGVGPGLFRLTGVTNPNGLVVQTTGHWEGVIDNLPSSIGPLTQLVQSVDPTGLSKVKSIHDLDDLPNNLSGASGSTWLAGAHWVRRRNPPSGGWTLAVCTASGTVGGSPAPTWATFNAVP
jgi:hypothetical protein